MVNIRLNSQIKDEKIELILIYIYKNKNLKNICLQSYNTNLSSKMNNRGRYNAEDFIDDKFVYFCDYGEYEFNYNNNIIKIKYEHSSEKFGLVHKIISDSDIIISCNTSKDENENRKIIEEFIDNMSENILKNSSNYINIYINKENYWNFLSKIPKRNLDTIFLQEKNNIIIDINNFMESEDDYTKYGIPYKRNYLLYGPPGTGKTSLITTIASIYNLNIYKLNLTKALDDSDFMSLISRIKPYSLLILEDVDALFTERELSDSNKTLITFSGVLNVLDGVVRKNKQITIMTTNHIDKLDSAFKRPGRIDKIVKFDFSNKNQIIEMVNYFLKDYEENIKNEVINKILKIKTTAAVLQKFLFDNRNNKNILNNIDDYINLTEQYNKSNSLYM